MEVAPLAYRLGVLQAPNVTEDRGETVEQRPSVGRWLWLGAGFAAGLGVSVLFTFTQPAPLVTASTAVAVPEPDSLEVEEVAVGLEATVPGFPDGLVAITRSDGLSLRLTVWPVAGPLYHRTVPFGSTLPPSPALFDISGRRVATLITSPGQTAGVLYAGSPWRALIVAIEVVGFAWHDARPRTLAHSRVDAGELRLWVTTGNVSGADLAQPDLAVSAVGIGGNLVAWGDWGFGIQNESEVVVISGQGDITDVIAGRLLGSHPDGSLVIDEDGEISIRHPDGSVEDLIKMDEIGDARVARFSPDGSILAILGSHGVATVTVSSGELLAQEFASVGLSVLEWSSDSRFVLFPGFRGVIIMGAETGRMILVLHELTATGLATLSVDSS